MGHWQQDEHALTAGASLEFLTHAVLSEAEPLRAFKQMLVTRIHKATGVMGR